ncbi:TIGR02117 family protein [Shigella flexneri]|nr:TIGR02117 family protein [Escherichia coli]
MKTILLGLICLLLCSCATFPQAITPVNNDSAGQHTIYIVSHGWHTGLVIPATNVNRVLPQLTTRFTQPKWYEIGWGDKGFYQAQEVTSKLTMQAMFWSMGAVMHVVAFSAPPEYYFSSSEVKPLTINNSQLDTLMLFLGRSFSRSNAGNLLPLKKGIYGDSQFYAANGRYGILNTCNKWTAKGLQSAGIDIEPALKLTAESVMNAVKK